MNPSTYALNNRTFMVVLTILMVGAGLLSYQHLGQLEYPNFTIKTALLSTVYPGASAAEVEEEVTDVIEEAVQALGPVDEIRSTSEDGLSVVYVDIKDSVDSSALPQVWDELRRKVSDAQNQLPPGVYPTVVNDDFGDVYGVFFAITGDGYSYRELRDYAESLKKELLLCDNVAKIALWGDQHEVIYVEFDQARIAELGLSPQMVFGTLQAQNVVEPGGQVRVGDDYIRISPSGTLQGEDSISDLLIGGPGGLVRLGDIAHIVRSYQDPPSNKMYFNGQPAIGLGISTVADGNVVKMGQAIEQRMGELESLRPLGMDVHTINFQSADVTKSVNVFVINLIEAVAIVVILLMFFMGWQSGLLIGVVLLLTILSTFSAMLILDINLQKISLGALILALGMLVDNAIVVCDGILIRVEKGESRTEAAVEIVRDTRWPLLGATLVAILAFAAIGYSPGNVGEFCRSLFQVMALSLLISWVLAVTVTPLFCVWFLKIPDLHMENPYDRPMFRTYRRFLNACIHHRWVTMAVTILLMGLAVFGFRFVPQSFFPDSTNTLFLVNMWLPQGTHIDRSSEVGRAMSDFVEQMDEVENVTLLVGQGGLRFTLSYEPETPKGCYSQLLVRAKRYQDIEDMFVQIERYAREKFPDTEIINKKIVSGPGTSFKIEARFRGPDIGELRSLSSQAERIMRASTNTRDVRTDWRQSVYELRPQFSEKQARRIGVTRSDVAQALQWNYGGQTVGLYREGDTLLPIVSRLSESERSSVDHMQAVQVWSSLLQRFVPLRQVASAVSTEWVQPLIVRRDRVRTITVQCNPVSGLADPLFQKLRGPIEDIELPPGYSLIWGGEYHDSKEGKDPLKRMFPICLLGMFIIVVGLFNSVRRPIIIFLTVPLSIIGVTTGLLLFGLPFGFMAILGFLGLSGMQIKNAIVLIDQIELDLRSGKHPYRSVLDASVSRMRPVMMASGTTILGMAPLVTDPFYAAMAVTIMGGLLAASLLTLVVVPTLYAIIYRIPVDANEM